MSRSPASILYDASGNTIGVVLDGSVYRLQAEAKLTEGGVVGDPVPVRAVGMGGKDPSGDLVFLKAAADGTLAVSTTPAAASLSAITNAYCEDGGGAQNMFVDGSSTPVEYTYDADATDDIRVYEIKFIVNASDVQFAGNKFCKINNPLTNGLKVEVTSNGTTTEIFNFKISEDFFAFSGGLGGAAVLLDQTDTSDLLTSTFLIGGGVPLIGGTSDNVKVTVRDDLENAGNILLRCYVKGNKVL